jgi:molecular chaperone DnaK (HSP70)
MSQFYGLSIDDGCWGQSTLIDRTSQLFEGGLQETIVAYHDHKVFVGHQAVDMIDNNPQSSVTEVKNFLRELALQKTYDFSSHQVTASNILTFLLSKIYQKNRGYIRSYTVAIPAYLKENDREKIYKSSYEAKLNIDHIVNLSTALAAYYFKEISMKDSDQFLSVYVGDQHTECALVRGQDHSLEVLGVSSDFIGEHHIVQSYRKLIKDKFKMRNGRELRDDQYSTERSIKDLENSLKNSTSSVHISDSVPLIDIDINEVMDIMEPHFSKIMSIIERTLKRYHMSQNRVVAFISFQFIKYKSISLIFEERKSDLLKKYVIDDTECAATLGAAWCSYLLDNDNYQALKGEPCADNKPIKSHVTPYSFGVLSMIYDQNAEKDIEQNSILIPKNSIIPVENSYRFITHHVGQMVMRCTVTQTEQIDNSMKNVSLLYDEEHQFSSISASADPDAIDVHFQIDESFTLRCRFENERTKQVYETTHNIKPDDVLQHFVVQA